MNREHIPRDELLLEIEELRVQLSEATATVDAIRSGHVDAVVVEGADGERQIFTLKGADHTYRALVEGMDEGALTLTPDGDILYCNRWFAEMVGTPLEQVIGSSIRRYISDADATALEALLHSESRGARRELKLRSADGALVPATLSMNTLETEDVPVLCIVATDLREQKRNEEMVASERLARSILDQAAEAIVVCDDRGTIVRASQLAHELSGQNPLMQSFEAVFPLPRGRGASRSAGRGFTAVRPAVGQLLPRRCPARREAKGDRRHADSIARRGAPSARQRRAAGRLAGPDTRLRRHPGGYHGAATDGGGPPPAGPP